MLIVDKLIDAIVWRYWRFRRQIMRGVVLRLPQFYSMFCSGRDAIEYVRAMISMQQRKRDAHVIRVKYLSGVPLLCRGATSDPWVLWDVFRFQFQQAPPEITDPRCIVDLGANVGYTSAYFAATYPATRILAVEMDSANFDLACRNVAHFGGQCKVVHAAVWGSDGVINYSGQEQQGYRAVEIDEGPLNGEVCSVAARGLSSLFDEFGVKKVDFLKMDIEGAESVVLRGSLDWLKCVKALKIELHAPMTWQECADILAREGFECRKDDRHDNCLVAIKPPPQLNAQPHRCSRDGATQSVQTSTRFGG